MQGTAPQSGNQNGKSQGGLSWTQPPSSSGSVTSNINAASGGAKPISQVGTSAMQNNKESNNSAKSAGNSSNAVKKNDAMQRQGSSARTAGIFIAGVVVGLVIGWGWFSLGSDTSHTAVINDQGSTASTGTNDMTGAAAGTQTGSQTSSQTGSMASGSGALSIAPLQSAGLSVTVSSVAVSKPTWVVIFDSVNGKPGNALGAQMFFPGDKSGTIELLRATVSGKSYFAGEYIDNGDHQFSKQADAQVNDASGNQMVVEFGVR